MKKTNLIQRSIAWTKCFFDIRKFPLHATTEQLVDFCMSQPIAPLQVRSELVAWAAEVAHVKPKAAMEIGTYLGGTLFLLCRLSSPEARVISVDVYCSHLARIRKKIFYSFLSGNQSLHIVEGDSHCSETLSDVSEWLGIEKLDFLFIDGDHSYEGVKRDFEMYSTLVRKGGVIAFHDILPHPSEANCHVYEFWREVKKKYPHKEIVERADQHWAGIGLLYV